MRWWKQSEDNSAEQTNKQTAITKIMTCIACILRCAMENEKERKDREGEKTKRVRGRKLPVGNTRWRKMGRGSNLQLIGKSAWTMAPTLSHLHPLYLCLFAYIHPLTSLLVFIGTHYIRCPLVQSYDFVLRTSLLLKYLLTVLVASLFEHSKRLHIK